MSFKRFFIIILFFSCFGCSNEQVRIVGNDGKRARLNTIVPEFNRQQLEKQKQAMSEYGTIPNFRQDYNAKPINNVNSDVAQKNVLIPGNYPDYIFADRVNNYDEGNDFRNNSAVINIGESGKSTSYGAVDIESKSKKINKIKENSAKNVAVNNSKLKYRLVSDNKVSNIEDTVIKKAEKNDSNKLISSASNGKIVKIKNNVSLTKNNIAEKNAVVKKPIDNTANKIDTNINDVKNNNITKNRDNKMSAILSSSGIKAADIKDYDDINASNTVVEVKDNKNINNVKPSNIDVNNKKTSNDVKYKGNSNNSYYIQLGIYSDKKNADNVCEKYSKIGSCSIELYNKKYKVVLGSYTDKSIAERDLEKVIKTGHFDVYITNKK